MARQGTGQNGDVSAAPDLDEFDAVFDAVIQHPAKECDIEDIDPSKPGWEIYLHFGDVDPRIPGTEANRDFGTLQYLEKFCIAKFEYKDGTKTVLLSHLDGCCEDELAPEHVEIMKKYTPYAKAPERYQKSMSKTVRPPAPPAIGVSTRDSAAEILANAQIMRQQPPVIKEAKEQQVEVPDDLIVTLPLDPDKLETVLDLVKCVDLDELLRKLQSIADEEELLFEHGEVEDSYIINIYKDPKVKYLKGMDPKNMGFISRLPYEKLAA